MADYCTTNDVELYLGGQFDVSQGAVIGTMITRVSRLFDRETGRPSNFWAAANGITRYYSGDGSPWIDLDEWNAITGVTMSTNQQRSNAMPITLSNDPAMLTAPATDPRWNNFAEIYPLIGPPYNQLFLLRGWLPDAYEVGNIAVTGNVITPEEIVHAVTIWAAYSLQAVKTGWTDVAGRLNSAGVTYSRGIPPEVEQIIEYYSEMGRGPKIAFVSGDDAAHRVSKWLGWQST